MSSDIKVADGFEWSFKEHVRSTVLRKNSKFTKGANDGKRPYKNIIRPILNVQYRTEGFDVKDIELFVDEAKNYYKSFLIKKYHTKWAREHELDTFIDELVESYVDFGGALVKKTSEAVPEVIPLQSIAFCDQTDLLGGPIGIKHYFSPSQLREMSEKGWGNKENGATATIDELIIMSQEAKEDGKSSNQTPGKYIEVYEVHGEFPQAFLKGDDYDTYVLQLRIEAFYTDKDGKKEGITLFAGKEKELPFRLILRDKIYGRALGMGGAEELFESQVWTNYAQIRIKEMLDAASKTVHITDDPNFANRNSNIDNVDNNQILDIAPNATIRPLDNSPRNAPAFDRFIQEFEAHAQRMGAASDPLLGEPAPSGTPFRAQERQVIEGKGIHEYRRGKIATFVDGIYKDWIIPHIQREVSQGAEFLAELDFAELQEISERIIDNQANRAVIEKILSGELVSPEEIELSKVEAKERFMKGGNKRFIKILEGELKDAPISIRVNIAGKQADLVGRVDKLVNVVRQILAAPQMLQMPGMKELFENILESSGLSPLTLGKITSMSAGLPQGQDIRSPQPALGQ